jgi:hypothetical protein
MNICDFPGSRPLGAPKDWDPQLDGQCGVLPVVDAVDERSGFNFMYSVWRPTAEELAELSAGGALRLGIMGKVHPVVNMAILDAETCRAAALVELQP